MVSPQLPSFPAGTQVALVRQLMLFDNQAKLQGAPVTESVQIRVYRRIASAEGTFRNLAEQREASGQDFYEFVLSRPQLFASGAGGLRTVGCKEKEFGMFQFFGLDEGSPSQYVGLDRYAPILDYCVGCHRGPGINSLNSREHLPKPNWLEREHPENTPVHANINPWWVDETGLMAKQRRYDWGLLNGYWNSSSNK